MRKTLGMPVAVPPPNEQKRIVSKIEELFSDLDAGVAALRRAAANLRRYRASVLKAAVEGRLTAEWRAAHPDVEPASALLERILRERRERWEQQQLATYESKGKKPPKNWREKYKEPVGPEAHLAALPDGWCWATIDQVYPVFVDCAHRTPKYSDEGSPALRPRDVVNGELDLMSAAKVSDSEFDVQTKRRIPEPRDIIYSRELSFGWSVVVPENTRLCMSQGMVLFRTGNGLLADFVIAVLNGPIGRAQAKKAATGSAHPHINLKDIRQYSIPIPPQDEQSTIISELSERLSILASVELGFDHSHRRSERLRQSILKRAFDGNSSIPQDPTDEPAAELLQRILVRAHRRRRSPTAKRRRSRRRTKRKRRQPQREGEAPAEPGRHVQFIPRLSTHVCHQIRPQL